VASPAVFVVKTKKLVGTDPLHEGWNVLFSNECVQDEGDAARRPADDLLIAAQDGRAVSAQCLLAKCTADFLKADLHNATPKVEILLGSGWRAGSGNLNSWDKWIFCLTAA
jgi:hypothetical protein